MQGGGHRNEIGIIRSPLPTISFDINNPNSGASTFQNNWSWSNYLKVIEFTPTEALHKSDFKVANTDDPAGISVDVSNSSAFGIFVRSFSYINATTLDVFNLTINGTSQPALVIKNKYLNKYFRSIDGINWTAFSP